MTGISRLCNLIAVSLRPYLARSSDQRIREGSSPLAFSTALCPFIMVDLILQVHKQIHQWTNESDCEGEQVRC
ncbi:hypothetical protein B296_00025594 [Ensete ventricosum]|uniref:Uncharacterized protein n=1 Tax=Ensete ventricosum TaxID=4639 RepID=A0A427ASP7_ENSVE|nr:hypothetical protein B296_00025594 [Ensete ventricosum]